MGRGATVAVLALAVGTLPTSAAKVERVDVPGGSLRLEVPSTWVRVPRDELELRSLVVAEATGGAAAELYDAAFTPRGAAPSNGPPMLLVQGRESGRLSWARFARLPTAEAVDAAAARRLVGSGIPFGDTTRVQWLAFDRARHALEMSSLVDPTPWGPLEVRSTLFLTSSGGVALHAISRAEPDNPLDDLWQAMIASVELDAELRYRPQLGDAWPWMLAWPSTWYAAAVLVAALAAWAVVRGRRRRGTV